MISKANIHLLLRFLGFVCLFLVAISNSPKFESPIIDLKYIPYLIIVSLGLISLGLYFKIKFAEKEPSTITYVVTFMTLLVALTIGSFYLFAFFYPVT